MRAILARAAGKSVTPVKQKKAGSRGFDPPLFTSRSDTVEPGSLSKEGPGVLRRIAAVELVHNDDACADKENHRPKELKRGIR